MRVASRLFVGLWVAGMLSASGHAEPQSLDSPMSFVETVTEQRDWGSNPPKLKREFAIQATGKIVSGTAAQLQNFLRETRSRGITPSGTRIYLNSPGGDLEEGLALGRAIRENGLDTQIGSPCSGGICTPKLGLCASACTFAFLGGVKRRALDWDIYGVHRFFRGDGTPDPADLAIAQRMTVKLHRFVQEMGVDTRLVELMVSAGNEPLYTARPPVKLYVLSMTEMANLRVVTYPPDPITTTWQRITPTSISATTEKNEDLGLWKYQSTRELKLECARSGELRMSFKLSNRATNTEGRVSEQTHMLFSPVVISAGIDSVQLLESEFHLNFERGDQVAEMRINKELMKLLTASDELTLAFGDPFGGIEMFQRFGFDLNGGKSLLSSLVNSCS